LGTSEKLPHLHQAIPSLPMLAKMLQDSLSIFSSNCRIALLDEARSFSFGQLQQLAIAENVGDAQTGHAGLLGAEKLARAAQFEIEFGDSEAVLCAHHLVKAALGSVGNLAAGHEHTERFGGATADASAKLVKLREAESFGMFDDHDGCIGPVNA